jgi:arylsulfatase A-like enzyme
MFFWLVGCVDPQASPNSETPETSTVVSEPPTSPGGTTVTPPQTTLPVSTRALVFDGDPPTNVLMISIDTTRKDQLGIYSTEPSVTPFLDSLAESGVRLDDHQQCSNWTFGSTSCTLAGRLPEETGFIPSLNLSLGDPDNQVPDGQRTLATRLRAAGYYTLLSTSNGWLGPDVNNAQGYADVEQPFNVDATNMFSEATDLLADQLDAGPLPWLVHVHLIEPHAAYNPPDEYLAEEAKLPPLPDGVNLDNQFGHYAAAAFWPSIPPEGQANLEAHLWARYRGELAYLDDQLEEIWPALDASGVLDDTLVLFWTDHGEQFWERGNQSHAYDLQAEENDGVLFFWAKNLVPGKWTGPTHAVDLVPTVLDAVGVAVDPLDPPLAGEIVGLAAPDRARFATSDARMGLGQMVTVEGWKLAFNFDGTLRLYDRNTDPHELVDLYVSTPDDPHVAELWDHLLPRVLLLQDLRPGRELVWPLGLPTQ